MEIRILTANDLKTALPMPKAIDAMRLAFAQFSAGHATMPLRAQIATDKGVSLLMPAYLHKSNDLSVKIVSIYGDNPNAGLPVVTATVLVLDPDTGLPLAFMDGSSLTAIRTGAGGGLAADLLARKKADTVALFGAGIQARVQLEGVRAVREIKRVNLISRTLSSAQKLAGEIAAGPGGLLVNLASTPREAVREADIVIAATTSATPLFDGDDLKPGAHVTGVGSFTPKMQEVDDKTVRRARIVVDSREACLSEAGDIIIAGAEIDAELGEIINGVKQGRRSDEEITFFKSVGIAVQDAVAASVALKEAEKKGLGTLIKLS